MALLSLPTFVLVLIFVCSFAYLSWQANIDIPEKDTLFKVEIHDSVTATRNSNDNITVSWNTSITPSAIAVISDTHHTQSSPCQYPDREQLIYTDRCAFRCRVPTSP